MNLLHVQSHKSKIIIVKRLIQGRNKVTRVRIESRSCNQGRRKSTPFQYFKRLQNDDDAENSSIRQQALSYHCMIVTFMTCHTKVGEI